MAISRIESSKAAVCLVVLSLLLAAAAIALHSPGQLSMDTSVQLHEASTGQSASWNPPFMSALMRWVGGGEVATAFLVLLSSVLTYLSLGQVAAAALRGRAELGHSRIASWRIAVVVILLINPVIFIYVGIVWKDVLFASLLTAAVALSFAAANQVPRRALGLGLAAIVVLACAMQVRQQGVFMGPVLLLMPIIAIVGSRGWSRARQLAVAVGLFGVFLVALLGTQALVHRSIANTEDHSSTVGFNAIRYFDIAGIVARSETPTEAFPQPITNEQRAAIRRVYSSQRIDTLDSDPISAAWLDQFTDKQRKDVWLLLVRKEPKAYLEHKWVTFRTVLDLNGLTGCLPVHIGVEGNSDYLRSVGIAEGRDSRDVLVYRIASWFFDWPLYRHWFYLLLLLGAVVAIGITRLPPRFKALCMTLALATGLFYLSYLPTTLSCDFRYMYGGIPLITVLWLIFLAGGVPARPAAAAIRNEAPSA
jgi:hypothetical protein